MKLELIRVVQGCRLGVLTELGRAGQKSLELPSCLLYTRCGSVPHLTQDTLHTLSNLPLLTQVTLSTIAEHQEVLEEYKQGVRKFAGLHDTLLYCSLHDPASQSPVGHITNKTVSVWGSGGRIEMTVARFMAIQRAVQPDWYQSMADGETWPSNTSRKRVRKSVDRTLAHLDECLLLHHKTEELRGVEVFGVVEGGDLLDERLRSAKETAKRPVGGFCLDGFHTGSMDQDLRIQLITAVTQELPEDKPRLLQGVGRPDEVIASVEAGVDLFESFFPFQVTERGCALCFDFNIALDCERAGTAPPSVLELGEETRVEDHTETPVEDHAETPVEDHTENKGDANAEDQTRMTPFEISLWNKRYKEDFRPLVEGCSCYCCQNHHRAYVHHLLVTNELLARVLLMLHNTAHYCAFFSALREALASSQLDALKRRVLEGKHGRRNRAEETGEKEK